MAVGSTLSYSSLIAPKSTVGSIAGWLNHSLIETNAPTIVFEAEAWIYRGLRHWRMVVQTTGAMTLNSPGGASPVDYIALPEDYLEDRVLYITGTSFQKQTRKTMEEVIAAYGYDGSGYRIVQQPMVYFSDSTNIKFDSPPDQAYPYLLYYYQQPQALATTNVNWLTKFYPRLVRCATCMAAAEFMKDVGQGTYDRTYWAQQAQMELDKAQVESDHSVRSQNIGMILE